MLHDRTTVAQPETAVVLVGRADDRERLARRLRPPSAIAAASASGVRSSAWMPAIPSLRESDRARARARAADRPACSGQIADELLLGAALDAAAEVRQVAGEPQELELEREHERVERRHASGGAAARRARRGSASAP